MGPEGYQSPAGNFPWGSLCTRCPATCHTHAPHCPVSHLDSHWVPLLTCKPSEVLGTHQGQSIVLLSWSFNSSM